MRLLSAVAGLGLLLASAGTSSAWEWYVDPYFGAYSGMTTPCNCYNIGVNGGVNFLLHDQFIVGVDAQAGMTNAPGGTVEGFLLGKGGMRLTNDFDFYGLAGFGMFSGSQVTAAGGGVEFRPVDDIGLAAEAIGINFGAGFTETRLTLKIVYHPNGD